MKKEDVSGIIVYLLIMALAVLFGINVLQTYADKSQLGAMYFLFILGAIVVGVVFNAEFNLGVNGLELYLSTLRFIESMSIVFFCVCMPIIGIGQFIMAQFTPD